MLLPRLRPPGRGCGRGTTSSPLRSGIGSREVHQHHRPLLPADQDTTPVAMSPFRRQNPRDEPGALAAHERMNAAELQDFLYRECGLKGLSGISNDVRELEASSDPRARFALDYFAYRVGLQAGQLAAALGGVDGFLFTAGIGENSPGLRARIAEKLAWLGGTLDPAANAAGAPLISTREGSSQSIEVAEPRPPAAGSFLMR
jgi:hypothetical protein